MKKDKTSKIDEAREIISELKVKDFKEENLIIALTKLKTLLDETFELIKFRKSRDLPYVMKDGNI